MTDLLLRLRHPGYSPLASGTMVLDHNSTRADMREAAAALEQMRDALSGLLDWVNEGCPAGGRYAATEAETALRGWRVLSAARQPEGGGA